MEKSKLKAALSVVLALIAGGMITFQTGRSRAGLEYLPTAQKVLYGYPYGGLV